MSKRRVVITGLGIVSPVGSTVDTAWQNVVEGKSGIGPITRFDVSAWPVRFHGPVAGFEAEKYLSAKELRKMDPFMPSLESLHAAVQPDVSGALFFVATGAGDGSHY